MRIVTYNIHGGKDAHGKDSLTEIARTLQATDGDFLLLQELDRRLMRSGFRDQAKYLAQFTGTTSHFYGRLRLLWAAFGNGILTRTPGVRVIRLPLPAASGEPRGAIGVHIENGPTVWCTHLGLHERWRQTQLAALAAAVAESTGPVIVGGDFNARINDPELREFLSATALTPLTPDEPTFTAANPTARIDFIFGRGVRATSARVIAAPGSDHCLVWVDVETE